MIDYAPFNTGQQARFFNKKTQTNLLKTVKVRKYQDILSKKMLGDHKPH